jgi:methylmalonyl-CoA mutase N-terminal domain/subunit
VSAGSDDDPIARERARWLAETYGPAAAGAPQRRKRFSTSSAELTQPLQTPADLGDVDYLRDLGFPGEPPFTRGIHPTMYRGRPWTMRQYAGFGSCAQTNERYRYLLGEGVTGLSVAFDLPTQMGYDSDDPLSAGEVGRVGVAIDSVEDMETLLAGIPLESVSISMTINAPASLLLLMLVAVAQRRGMDPSELRGTIQNDILKEYMARGTYIFPPAPSMRLTTDTFAWCAQHAPDWNTISVSGYHVREAGATAVQELAFTLADAIAYCEAARDAGLAFDDFAQRLSFFFNVHNNFLEEVAKFRAARVLWHRIATQRFGSRDPRAQMLRFHTQTAGSTLTAQQPLNNVVRVAIQALAAVLGGTQSLHTNSFDEALGLPMQESVRVALRTQQILAEESGVADVVDALGGSYTIERLTRDLLSAAEAEIGKIDTLGGMVRAIELRHPQAEIERSAYRYQQALEAGERVVVGVNRYAVDELPPAGFVLDPAIEAEQRARLAGVRAARDGAAVERALVRVEEAARGSDNLLPPMLEAVHAQATVGEICSRLRAVFGTYRDSAGGV